MKNRPDQTITKADFEQIFLKNYGALIATGLQTGADRALVQDAIQSLFLELWQNRVQFTQVEHHNAYLRKALHRKVVRLLKKKSPIQSLDTSNLFLLSPSYEELLIQLQTDEDTRLSLENALSTLPDQQLVVLRLRFFEGMSYTEIAEQTGKSKQTIYNQIFSAIQKLKNAFKFVALMSIFH